MSIKFDNKHPITCYGLLRCNSTIKQSGTAMVIDKKEKKYCIQQSYIYYWLSKMDFVSDSGSKFRSPKRSITTFLILPVNRAPGLYSSLTGVPVSIPILK